MNNSRSHRIVKALLQLPQFSPFAPPIGGELYAVNVINGVRVYPLISDDPEHGLIALNFMDAFTIEVVGELYLELQAHEAMTHYKNLPWGWNDEFREKEASAFLNYLEKQYDLA